jgi:hypothetical protein
VRNSRTSFEIYEHINEKRSKSMMSKDGKRESDRASSALKDGKDYYRDYEDNKSVRNSTLMMNDDLVAECYVGFSKLM